MFGSTLKFNKRKTLAQALEYSHVLPLARTLNGSALTVFSFHRIAKEGAAETQFDDTVFGPSENFFRKHLLEMKRHADPVSESDLLAFFKDKTPLPKNGFMITFDDGYRDNYEVALPILKDVKVPAIFFIPTETIEKRGLGWWDVIYWLLKQTKKPVITIRGKAYDVRPPYMPLAENFLRLMKSCKVDSKTLLEELHVACGVDLPSKEICDKEMMTWEQIIDSPNHGISIGSHTHTHRVLSCLDVATQREELVRSKAILEAKLGRPVHSIAYPVGGYEHFNTETMGLTTETGYDLAFSFLTGTNRPASLNNQNIKRLEPQNHLSVYGGLFSMPWLFGARTCAIREPRPNTRAIR